MTTDGPACHAIDLVFSNRAERDRQYNARASVENYEACVQEYADLSKFARRQCVGVYDLKYGLGHAERLDLFPAPQANGLSPLLIFIHGGYWRAQTKENSALMAKVFTDAGIAVATLEYPLLPMATLGETVRAVRSALAWLHQKAAMFGIDAKRIYASGSSAGGHLAGMLMAPNWQSEYGLPADVVKGGLGLSGLYDIQPLCDTHVNDWLRLYPEQARRLSPMFQLPEKHTQLILAVGGKETQGFRNQTAAYQAVCESQGVRVTRVRDQNCNHFNLLCELAREDSELTLATVAMINGD